MLLMLLMLLLLLQNSWRCSWECHFARSLSPFLDDDSQRAAAARC